MKRLELFEKLHGLETDKQYLEDLLHDTNDYYCKSVSINASLDTDTFRDKREYICGGKINVNKERFIKYLKQEIEGIDQEVSKLLEQVK